MRVRQTRQSGLQRPRGPAPGTHTGPGPKIGGAAAHSGRTRRVLSPLKSPVSATTVVNCLSWSRADSILWRFTGDPDMARSVQLRRQQERGDPQCSARPDQSEPKLSVAPPLEASPALVLGSGRCRPRPRSLVFSSLGLGYFPPVQGGWNRGAVAL